MRNSKPDSLASRVLAVIKENPGCNVAFISDQLDVESKKVKGSIAFHRSEGRIINRGRAARGASWYPDYDHPENAPTSPITASMPAVWACRKCGNREIVGRIELTVVELSGSYSQTVVLCGHCFDGVHQTVEHALLEEIGER
jgi:hypothetical protein